MSVTISVELSSARLPPAAKWAQAIRDHGFATELPTDFEPLDEESARKISPAEAI